MADFAASLSVGEKLLIYRKRAGASQAEMAASFDLTRTQYGKMERDQLECVMPISLGDIKPHEEAMILRRRLGETQKEIAEKIGLSRHWVSKMETGQRDCERLLGGVNA